MGFSIGGIPVRIHGSFAFVALIGLSGGVTVAIIWVLVVFVTTLVHELGHAVAFRRYGRDASITLWGLGGLTQGSGPPLDRKNQIFVSFAGPLIEIILIGIPALILRAQMTESSDATRIALELTVWVGVGWALINLLPVLPLDGGKIAANLMEGAWGIKGARAARILSMIVAAAGSAYAVFHGFIFGAFFGLFFIAQNRNDLQRMKDVPAVESLARGHDMLDQGDAAGAAKIGEEVASKAQNPLLLAAALHLNAWANLALGNREAAAASLARLPQDVRPSRAILAYTLILDGHTAEATQTAIEAMLEGDAGLPPNAQLPLLLEREGLLDGVVERLLHAGTEEGVRAVQIIAEYMRRTQKEDVAARIEGRLQER